MAGGDLHIPAGEGAYWSRDAADLLGVLDSSSRGLSSIEAEARLARHGETHTTKLHARL